MLITGGLLNGLYYACLLAWALVEARGAVRQRRAVRREGATSADRGSYLALVGGLVLGLVVAGVISRRVPAGDLHWNQPFTLAVASLLIVAGILFRGYAVRTLGRYFTNDVAVSADQPVMQGGPYRLIRHPAYAGSLLSALGAGLGMTNWISLVALLGIALAGMMYRMGVEERAMAETIGEPYRVYLRRTKRLIPYVY